MYTQTSSFVYRETREIHVSGTKLQEWKFRESWKVKWSGRRFWRVNLEECDRICKGLFEVTIMTLIW